MANVVVSSGPERPDRAAHLLLPRLGMRGAVTPLTRTYGMVVKHREDSGLPGYDILSLGEQCWTSQRHISKDQNP